MWHFWKATFAVDWFNIWCVCMCVFVLCVDDNHLRVAAGIKHCLATDCFVTAKVPTLAYYLYV